MTIKIPAPVYYMSLFVGTDLKVGPYKFDYTLDNVRLVGYGFALHFIGINIVKETYS